MRRHLIAAVLIVTALMAGSMLSFLGTTTAAPPAPRRVPTFADTAGRELQMIAQLQEIVSQTKMQNDLLREQNALLKSGKLRVVVVLDNKAGR
jgi:hypothetical protein